MADDLPRKTLGDDDKRGPLGKVVYCAPAEFTRLWRPGMEPWPTARMSWDRRTRPSAI